MENPEDVLQFGIHLVCSYNFSCAREVMQVIICIVYLRLLGCELALPQSQHILKQCNVLPLHDHHQGRIIYTLNWMLSFAVKDFLLQGIYLTPYELPVAVNLCSEFIKEIYHIITSCQPDRSFLWQYIFVEFL